MSVNLEIHVGLWIPKSVPYTVISASLRSRMFVFTPGTPRFEYFRLLDRAHRGEAGWELIGETQDHFDNHYVESPLWREARGAA